MFKTLLIVLALLLFPSVCANAREITSGTVTIPASFAFVPFVMDFSGNDFSVSAAGNNFVANAFAPCHIALLGCSAGQVVALSARSGQWDFSDLSGTMTIDGTQYIFFPSTSTTLPFVTGGGNLSFTGGSVMIPFSDAPTITLKAPFSMSGILSGRAGVFQVGLPLSGSGTAFLFLGSSVVGDRHVYFLRSLTYRFGLPVAVDIKPDDDPNDINLKSRGKLPVAILSTVSFDASAVNPATVTVAGASVDLRPNGTLVSSLEDINGDGLLDLVVHVSTTALQLTNFDTEALVEGHTFDGEHFWGSDTIAVVH